MRIIKDSKTIKLPADSTQRFFIQSWFSLVHMNSLDSHRVRCMNTINIIDELMDLISPSKRGLSKIKNEISRVASEAIEIIDNDMIIQEHFGPSWNKVKPLLRNITPKQLPPEVFTYFLKDLQTNLKANYKRLVIASIKREVGESKEKHHLFGHIAALLSMLIHDGHSLVELFAIVRNIFIANKSRQSYSFDDNFKFVSTIISREPSQYNIIFRLQGCSKYGHLKDILGDRISPSIELNGANNNVTNFLNPGQSVLFAKFEVSAQDDRSAGLSAKRELDSILDLIRFELEHRVISVDSEFISVRQNENAARRFRLPTIIPNPAQKIEPQHFGVFIERFNRISQQDGLDAESKEKIRSALRFYRMGRDSDLFENKFLNWWTALEFLTRTGEDGGIINEVKGKLLPMLVLHYLKKHLISYKNALLFCGVKNITEQTTLVELFTQIHDSEEYNKMINQIEDIPFLKYKIEDFKAQTADVKTLSAFHARHEEHLIWHIHRIWRIRCDIVHSAEYSLNLNLLSANLEYYLKSLLSLIINSFASRQGIGSINELYIRYQYAHKQLKEEMKKGNPDLHLSLLAEDLL
jgi:hypothetical protein